RLTGSDPGRLLALDALLELANRNDWAGVVEQRHKPLIVGESLVPQSLEKYFSDTPMVVYIHSPTCIHCRRLVDHGVQGLINDFARLHPNVQYVVLQEKTKASIVEVLGG